MNNLPGVPGRLLFLLTEFELGLGGLGFEFEVPLKLEVSETASSDIIFEMETPLIKTE